MGMNDFINSITDFAKNPFKNNISEQNKILKLIYSGIVLPVITFCIGSLLWFVIEFAQTINLFKLIEEDYNAKRGVFFNLIITIILAPLIEEVIFRLPLKFLTKFNYYKLLFYGLLLIFGIVHYFNYQTSENSIYYILLIVSPQVFAGFIFSFVRINFGFCYGCLTHSIYNLIGFSFLYYN